MIRFDQMPEIVRFQSPHGESIISPSVLKRLLNILSWEDSAEILGISEAELEDFLMQYRKQ